jgi:DNA-binding SARP family transcriptional activator
LFDILAKEVLVHQPPDVRQFMKITSTLQLMTPKACEALPGVEGSRSMLEEMHRQDLFVFKVGEDLYRYHHIFHRFLRQQTDEETSRTWHQHATAYYRDIGDLDAAFYHAVKAGDDLAGATILTQHGEELLRKGRYKTLTEMLDALGPEMLHQHPPLLFFLGELARMQSRFQEALGWYQQAEALWRERGQIEGIGRALRGQARVYLDTVNPSKAEDLLQQALRLSDGTVDRDTMANLYELLAENKLNAGKGDEAEAYRRKAQVMRQEGPTDSQLLIRVLLRTGRLAEARQQLEQLAEIERAEPVQKPRAHRETHLLLSVIYAMQGEAQAAYKSAREGTQRGKRLDSPYVTAVGYIRQGHALMMLSETKRYQKASERFKQAIELSRSLHIPRLRIETYWGLTRAYGYRGDLVEADQMAMKGIEMATKVGDEWIASLIRCTMGASHMLASEYEQGHEWLAKAMHGFQECSDPFGLTSARLWRCLGWFYAGEMDQFDDSFKLVLEISLRHEYGSLLTKPTLLGVPDERRLVPMLLHARRKRWSDGYPDQLLHDLGLGQLQLHPGYQLKIETLGAFKVWRGYTPIAPKEWKREKARQLLQVLISNREAPLDRDQICECLWPGMEPEISHRNFKVALSTLYQVLEPERGPGSDSAYVVREGSTYALRPGADLWLDADEMDTAVQQAERIYPGAPNEACAQLARVLDLYQGEFLPDVRYEIWSAAERERLTVQFLRSCDRLCEWSLESDPEAVIDICQRVLAVDNCWERAYRFTMQAYAQLGDHGQVARTFKSCLEVLRAELDVAPAAQTYALYYSLIEKGEQTPGEL